MQNISMPPPPFFFFPQILFGVVSAEEKKQMTPVVYSNTIMSMKILVEQATLLGEEVSQSVTQSVGEGVSGFGVGG